MKLKLILGIILSIFTFLLVTSVTVRAKNGGEKTFSLPSQVTRLTENVYYLGKASDVDGRQVEGYAFVHGKANEARPLKPPKGGGPSCYGFLANGAKWKVLEPWIVNPQNASGLQ